MAYEEQLHIGELSCYRQPVSTIATDDTVAPPGWHTLDIECKGVLSIGV